MTITLSGTTIRLEPPQHVAMIEVTPTMGGPTIKILHASGQESEGDEGSFTLLGKSPPWSPRSATTENQARPGAAYEMPGVPAVYLEAFPSLGEVDIRNLPRDYRTVPNDAARNFSFEAGEAYNVFVLGEKLSEMVIVAE